MKNLHLFTNPSPQAWPRRPAHENQQTSAPSPSLNLLWQDILAKKHIKIRRLDFASANLPIIAIAMTVGCTVLVGEVYIAWDESPYRP